MASVQTGLDRVLNGEAILPAGPLAFCTNYTSVTEDLGRGVDALLAAGADIRSLLTPEHGYWGAAQAGESGGDSSDAATGLPILDTYLLEGEGLDALLRRTEAPQVVVDMQDIGTRFYTYMWTLYDLLCSAARTETAVTVLDRPNPLGTRSAGPGLAPEAASFVGRVSIPLQHGRTLGELALWFNEVHVPAATGSKAELEVITCTENRPLGAHRWVMPSPNMPTTTTAVLYPATGLIEGTTLSEGRGTTAPFELFGAAWTDSRLAAALREHQLPGLEVREAVFRPTFSKWAGETVHGVQFHLTDAEAFEPVTTGWKVLKTIAQLYPEQQLWREQTDATRPPFIDLLWGSAALREGIDDDAELTEVLAASPAAEEPPAATDLYSSHR